HWAGREDRRTPFGERQWTRWRKARTTGSGYDPPDSTKRGAPEDIAVGQRKAWPPVAGCARTSCRPWRDALLSPGACHTRIVGRSRKAGAPGAAARAIQSRTNQNGDEP